MTQTTMNRRSLIAAGGAGLMAAAFGAPALAQELSDEDKALIAKATAYIQGLSNAKGRFVQTDPRGVTTQGTLWLQRPGKARFEYDGPNGLLVVSNGNNVNIFDSRLKTFESYPLSRTPLALLLAREVRLDRGVKITSVRKLADGFTIVAQDARRQTLGRLEMNFSSAPELIGWTISDVKGGQTRVRLSGLDKVAAIDPKLFVLTDPRRRTGKPATG
ncbi:outer-membrane lipoprotein carrier protein LolA [Caulobacter endophyticus]|uniref:outer-membrane lipoprotein carrier protein LolA n=1 Tax=Caulobacter endophyticus TaxID=2172652 RepID=UPI003D66B54E